MAIAADLDELPPLLKAPVRLWLERLEAQGDELPDRHTAHVIRTVACSEFAGTVLLRNWSWFVANGDDFDAAPVDADLEDLVVRIASGDLPEADAKSELRRFRNRFLLRVLWREIHGLADLDETLHRLSLLADRLLDAATRCAEKYLQPRYGRVRSDAGTHVPLVILGMGKLGGRELNFSSDIDLIFCYPEDGQTDGAKSVSAQEYFARLSRQVIALIDEVTTDGFVFRIDTRLRPFGDSGPPVVSFAALESYLLQHGRDWERYAYVKARVVGPRPPEEILDDLYGNMIQPFVYRRYLDFGVFESLREMQALIAAEVRRKDLVDNVKLGPGGIREAEFIVQALQLVRGGSEPALQGRELQTVLPRLVSERGLSAADAQAIRKAYRFLRRLENFIQALRDRQTHDLPDGEEDRARIALAMGCSDWDSLHSTLTMHRDSLSRQFASVAFRGADAPAPAEDELGRLWEGQADAAEWQVPLERLVGGDAASLSTIIAEFAGASATRQTDSPSRDRLRRLIPELLTEVANARRPRVALERCLAVVERILRRSAYIALLCENRPALSRFVDLCERSQYVADQLARFPVLLDELLDPRIYSEAVDKSDIAAELALRLDADDDSEARMQKIALFQRSLMFRIAVADFNGSLPIMKVSDGLTWLAEVILDEALHAAWDDLVERHGEPEFDDDGRVRKAGFGIVGYGKLGGLELSYGSDLDIVFLHNSRGTKGVTNGEKPLDNTMFFSRLVRRLLHFLTTQTGSGELYEIDTRLRPDGRSGVLVTSLEGFEAYQEENAWTWEHQALLRARPVAGDKRIAKEFERIRHDTLMRRVRRAALREEVIEMKRRMRKTVDKSRADCFDLKHGLGGIGDIEFLVQYLVLGAAGDFPGVIEYSDNIRQLDALIAAGVVGGDEGGRLQDIYRQYRTRLHHLVLDDRPPLVGADTFSEQREFVRSVWRERLG